MASPVPQGKATPDSIARELKVGTLVEGTIAQSGDRLRVNVSLVDASTGVEIGSKTLERLAAEMFALQDDLAKEVAVFLRSGWGRRSRCGRAGSARAAEAWELLQRAEQSTTRVRSAPCAADTKRRPAGSSPRIHLLVQAEARTRAGHPVAKRGWLAYRQSATWSGSFDKSYYAQWTELGTGPGGPGAATGPPGPERS